MKYTSWLSVSLLLTDELKHNYVATYEQVYIIRATTHKGSKDITNKNIEVGQAPDSKT